jgi:hypothetical protein
MTDDDPRAAIRKKFAKEFSAYEGLVELTNELMDRNPERAIENSERPATGAVGRLFAKGLKTVLAIHLLAREGFGEDAVDLGRTLTNLCIDMAYICEGDSDNRARQWSEVGKYERLKMERGFWGALPDDQESEYRSLRERTGEWTRLGIQGRADRGGTRGIYETSYRHSSSVAHSDSWSTRGFLKSVGDELEAQSGPSDASVDDALLIGATAMAMIVVTWAKFFGMDISDYDRAMRPVLEKGFGAGVGLDATRP